MLEELSENELLRIIRAYDRYVQDFLEDEVHEGMIPVCVNEFVDNEYNYYLEIGDIIRFDKEGAETLLDIVEDLDLHDWLMCTRKKNFKVIDIDRESGLFWIEDCEYAISFDENWERVKKD